MWKRLKDLMNDKQNQTKYLRWLITISKPFRRSMMMLIAINCLVGIVSIGSALLQKQIIDFAKLSFGCKTAILLAFLCIILSFVLNIAFRILSVKLTETYACHLRSQLFRHILKSVWKERREYHSEELLSRLTSDVNLIADGGIQVAVSGITFFMQFLMTFGLLWYYEKTLAMISILVAPIAVFVNFYFGSQLATIHNNVQQSEANYRTYLQEQISNADIILAFEQEDHSIQGLDELQKKRMYWIQKMNRYTVLCSTLITTIFSITYLIAFVVGAIKIGEGSITYGTLTVFLSLVSQIQMLVYNFGNLLPKIVSILASSGRVMQITKLNQEEADLEVDLYHESQDITFSDTDDNRMPGIFAKNLTLCYHNEEIIKDFSMSIQPGKKVLLKGVSGIGKTTLIRAILGFIHPEQGSLQLYNVVGKNLDCTKDTRAYISYVPQGNTLFMGTIEENLRIGCQNATFEQMKHALEIACAWEFIKDLPEQLQTRIGERGAGLSEGQAQRIGIARAMLRKASIYIFDESTSALDEETEERVLMNIKDNLTEDTCIYISHRSKISDYVDYVVEMKES